MRIVVDPEETVAISEFACGVPLPLVTLHFRKRSSPGCPC